MKNNKSLKVLSTAAIAAALVAPTVAVQPAFAASTYSVSGVQNAAAGSTINEKTRINVSLPAGTLYQSKTFQLRLPAESTAILNNVNKDAATFSRGDVAAGVKQEVTTPVTSGAAKAGKISFKVKDTLINDVDIADTDNEQEVATKIAKAIKDQGKYDASANGANVIVIAPTAANNDDALKITDLADPDDTKVKIGDSKTTKDGVAPVDSDGTNTYVPDKVDGQDNQVGSITIKPKDRNTDDGSAQVFEITVTPSANTANKGLFSLDLTKIKVPGGHSGALNATIDSSDDTFTNGEIKIAQVGNGSVTTSIDGTVALTPGNKNDTLKTIRIKEDSAGAFAKGQKYKLELPDGFEWVNSTTGSSAPKVTVAWGDKNAELKVVSVNKDTIEFELSKSSGNPADSDYPSTTAATQFAIDGLKVKVDDADAEKGEVKVKIKGDVSRTNDSIVIGTFGTYEGDVKAGDAKTVYGGQTGEELGSLTIKEDAPGTLQEDRTIKLKLTGNAKWATRKDSNNKYVLKEQPQIKNADSEKNGLKIGEWELSGSDRTVIQAPILKKSSTKPAKIVLEKLKVDVAPTAGKGDISVAVEGTTGVKTDSLVLGKTAAPVEISVDGELAKIDAGLQQQSIPNITIKEATTDLIDEKDLVVKFPEGVKPALPGKVEVTEGNLKIDSAKITVEDNKIIIPISKHSTTKAGIIKLSDIKVTSYRYVPEGDLKVKITGPAVVKNIKDGTLDSDYPFNRPNDTHVAEGSVAKVVTPADKNKYAENIVFKIGSKTYTQDGKEMTMDVAPEVHPVYNRTYIPAAHFAASLNIPADKVVWNEAAKTVTIFAGDKIVSATAGKKELVVNGTPVQIDAPVNYGQHTGYRVMVPYTHLALALGATVEWKADTQEIFVNKR
ncbi:copper amine oxidase N-terminal domain-containing protein [Aneurinibacillus aneurinilyticus]|uniref:copper amine oxidase N-terminal domain-containing protein n=1 Tax=Aneurinibacillus aneurinilyticus TaxID=1391 RepID=UPI0035241292